MLPPHASSVYRPARASAPCCFVSTAFPREAGAAPGHSGGSARTAQRAHPLRSPGTGSPALTALPLPCFCVRSFPTRTPPPRCTAPLRRTTPPLALNPIFSAIAPGASARGYCDPPNGGTKYGFSAMSGRAPVGGAPRGGGCLLPPTRSARSPAARCTPGAARALRSARTPLCAAGADLPRPPSPQVPHIAQPAPAVKGSLAALRRCAPLTAGARCASR